MSRADRPFTLAGWQVNPARGVLSRDGKDTRIEPQLMDLLLLFAGNPDRVIGKDEIIATVWKGRAIGDDTLAAAVSRLRAALGETKDKRYIETLPKRGYRLLVAPEGSAALSKTEEKSEADALVARGLAAMKAPQGFAQARIYFEGAIKADPKHARAHAGLAEAMLMQHLLGQGDAVTLLSAAKASACAATALDENLAPAWTTLGFATLLSDRDFAAADASLLKAIALDPALTAAHRHRAFALAAVGRFLDAEREVRKAIELESLSLAARGDLAQILLLARRYPQVVLETKRTLSLAPQSSEAWAAKGWAHHMLGEQAEARDAFLESLKAWGVDAPTLQRLADAHASGGPKALFAAAADLFEAQRMVFVARPTDIAVLRLQAGDTDAAFAALEAAAAKDDPYLLWIHYMPHLDRIRNDPRYVALLERIRPVR